MEQINPHSIFTENSKPENSKPENSKPKKSKPKCAFCKKKLKMTELELKCKCSYTFCLLHLNPHSHNCSFDYLSERREYIEKNNPKMCIQCIDVK
jgi:hypothetical protein